MTLLDNLYYAVGNEVAALLESGNDCEDIVGEAIDYAISNLTAKESKAYAKLSVSNLGEFLRKGYGTNEEIYEAYEEMMNGEDDE